MLTERDLAKLINELPRDQGSPSFIKATQLQKSRPGVRLWKPAP